MAVNERKVSGRSRLLVISDIHGYGKLLQQLLQDAEYEPKRDRLLMLGDYIVVSNPKTYGTLELVRKLVEQGARALPGNHEFLFKARLARLKVRNLALARSADWISRLPLYIKEDGYLFVHAGIRPGKPLRRQTRRDLTEIREGFLKAPINIGLTIVFGHTPTFKLGARPGHIWRGNGRIGIDTGAKHGHRLTLLDLHNGISYSRPAVASERDGSL